MDSIQITTRKISKASISFGVDRFSHLWKLAISDAMKILRKFSATIKYLELKYIGIEMHDFLEMLSLIPNAEYLNMCGVFEATRSDTVAKLNNECLQLDRLKTLQLIERDVDFLFVFSGLPAGVLNELIIGYSSGHFDVELLTEFFRKQSNIKKLTLSDDVDVENPFPVNVFGNLKLESFLCYQNEYSSEFANLLSKQTQLISLSLLIAYVDESVLNVIANRLSELETLEIGFDEQQVEPFKKIEKLKKLKELTLANCSVNIIEAFSGLDNSRITKLNMKHIYTWSVVDDDPPMPVNIIGALANSVPNLKVLRFDYYCECSSIVANSIL